MRRTAILGIGSPNGDDRAGWAAIAALEARLPEAERAAAGVTVLALDRPGFALLAHLRNAQRAVLIDALQRDAAPGSITMIDVPELQGDPARTSTHGPGVADALALGAALKLLPAELSLIGITARACAPAAAICAPARDAAERLGARLARWLREGGDLADYVLG